MAADMDVCRLLLACKDVDPNAQHEGRSILHCAAHKLQPDLVTMILARPGVDVNQRSDLGLTPLGEVLSPTVSQRGRQTIQLVRWQTMQLADPSTCPEALGPVCGRGTLAVAPTEEKRILNSCAGRHSRQAVPASASSHPHVWSHTPVFLPPVVRPPTTARRTARRCLSV